MEIGQKVYLEPIGNNARYSKEIKENKIKQNWKKIL